MSIFSNLPIVSMFGHHSSGGLLGGLFGGGGGGILGELNPINWIKSGIGQIIMIYIAIKLLFKFIDKI